MTSPYWCPPSRLCLLYSLTQFRGGRSLPMRQDISHCPSPLSRDLIEMLFHINSISVINICHNYTYKNKFIKNMINIPESSLKWFTKYDSCFRILYKCIYDACGFHTSEYYMGVSLRRNTLKAKHAITVWYQDDCSPVIHKTIDNTWRKTTIGTCTFLVELLYGFIYENNLFPQVCLDDKTESLHWRHNDHDGVSNHQPYDCLLNRLFRRRSKKTSKLRVTGLCAGNSLGTGEFPAQMASNAENVSIWWRHHENEWADGTSLSCV